MKKILVADDNTDIRKVIKAALSGKGYKIVEAEDGAAAIKKLQAEKFDLLITDYDMPGVNGVEVMEKALALYPRMPVLLVSANLPPAVAGKAKRSATCILEKPFEVSKFISAVSVLLK